MHQAVESGPKFLTDCAGKNKAPLTKKCQMLFPGTHEYVTLHGKRDVAGVITLNTQRRRHCSGLSGWARCNHRNPLKNRRRGCDDRGRVRERFEDGILLALKMGERIMSQAMWETSRSWKRHETLFSPRASGVMQSSYTLI